MHTHASSSDDQRNWYGNGMAGEDATNVNTTQYAGLGTAAAHAAIGRAAGRRTPFGCTQQNWRRREKFFLYTRDFAIDVTRARCITEVFQATEGQPAALRMATAIARTLSEMPLFIDDDDLFAGNLTGQPLGSHLYPELMPDYYLTDWDALAALPMGAVRAAPEDRAVLQAIAPYWRGRTVFDCWEALRDPEDVTRNALGVYFSYNMMAGIGHMIVNVPRVLSRGLAGLRSEAFAGLAAARGAAAPDPSRVAFYESVVISIDGVIHHAHRLAAVCADLATRAEPPRRTQLERMARACAWVPEHPARDSFEALQCALLLIFAVATESCQISVCPGRVDQWLAPYAAADLAAGTSPEELIELLEAFVIKLAHFRLFSGAFRAGVGGGSELCTLTIGGSHPDGSDATTVITELVLQAYNRTRLAHPPLAMRVHDGTPAWLWDSAVRCLSNGCGMPSFMNDAIMIPALMDLGFSREDAHDYADIGCVEMGSAGTSLGPVSIGFINLGKCLELALNDGCCALQGTRLGPATGTLAAHASFDAVVDAYRAQLAHAVACFNDSVSTLEHAHAELRPVPFLSALTDNALQTGRDLITGSSKYRYAGLEGIGFAEVADSLSAIRHFVFETRQLEGARLHELLLRDFAGDERTRLLLRNRGPKYGNDDDDADALMQLVANLYVDEIKRHRDFWGGEYTAGAWSIALAMDLGPLVGALPNGRHAGATMTEGIRPASGCDRRGPTAVLRSVAKVDHRRYQNGSICNLMLTPQTLEGDANRRKFADLVRTYCHLGGFQLQCNVVDVDVLRAAQADPERFRDLIVRVAGYCAYFVEQNPRVQEQIIARTAHRLR
jgi:pyruvate formate-lyase/glycerol dehydratase family glycyl radical enzyme